MAFQITVNITDAQEAALGRIAQEIAEKAGKPVPTARKFFEGQVNDLLGTLRQQYFFLRRERILEALEGATAAKLAQIETALGL